MEKIQGSSESYLDNLFINNKLEFSFLDYDFINSHALYINSKFEVLKAMETEEGNAGYICLLPESYRIDPEDDLQREFDIKGNMLEFV